MSPGSAPAMAIGPVRMWPNILGVTSAWTARCSGRISKPLSGMMSGPPEIAFTITESPDSTSRTGFSAASKTPQWTVPGALWSSC